MSELRWILLGCGLVLLAGIFFWGRRSRGQAAADDLESGSLDPGIEPASRADALAAGVVEHPSHPVGSRWEDNEWTSTVTDLPEMRFDSPHSFDGDLDVPLDGDELLPAMEDPFAGPGDVAPLAPPAASSPVHTTSEPARPKLTDKRKIIALRLSAPLTERYTGNRLRTAFDAMNLEHGRYGIFHRLYQDKSVFSVASMVEPGAFDLETMGETQFAGVTLFALLPGPVAGSKAYDQLIECARHLERTLGGELHDERGMPLTAQRVASLRDDVLDFEHLLGSSAHN